MWRWSATVLVLLACSSNACSGRATPANASPAATGPVPPVCGNGVTETGEDCDDANDGNRDGCRDCRIVEFQVNEKAKDANEMPDVAVASDGSFIVVWSHTTTFESQYDILGRRFDGTGRALGLEFIINQEREFDQMCPDVTLDASGSMAVVWETWPPYDHPTCISARILGEDAVAVTDDLPISGCDIEFPTGPHEGGTEFKHALLPHVASAEQGRFLVLWHAAGDAGPLMRAELGEGGHLIGLPAPIESDCKQHYHASLAAQSSGPYILSFACPESHSGDPGLFWGFLDGSGFEMSTRRVSSLLWSETDVAALPDGGAIVVWSRKVAESPGWDVMAQIIGGDGQPVGSSFQVNQEQNSCMIRPVVAADREGRIVVVWLRRGPLSGLGCIGADSHVTLRLFGPDGDPVTDEIVVNSHVDPHQDRPTVEMNGDGNIVVVWKRYLPDLEETVLMAQRFSRDGVPVGLGAW